ncbi:MAG: glycosyltransferase family 2 protein [Lachnospiraceae bacterium]
MEILQNSVELTILMPCLNEAETLETCIKKANTFLEKHHIVGEILIADNGSTDGSQDIAVKNGARVVTVDTKGYGAALIGGTLAAKGKYVIMGDADDSYDFLNLSPFVEKLRDGYELVMGNRFKGGIEKGAMPPLHRYLGNPILSFIGRLFYSSDIGDFHCGLRGYSREAILKLDLQTTGMEYASEMVVKATLAHLKIAEVPTTLSPDGRSRAPHLRSFRDGWRHLKFLLLHSPKWLFFYPGLVFFILGFFMQILLLPGPLTLGSITFDIHTMLYGSAFFIIGVQMILFTIFTDIYAKNSKFIPIKDRTNKLVNWISTEKGTVIGILLFLFGILSTILAFLKWGRNSFGNLNPQEIMRLTIPSLSTMVVGIQIIFSSFFIGILNIKHK